MCVCVCVCVCVSRCLEYDNWTLGAMGRRIDPSWWTHWAVSRSSQCTTTGVTKAVVKRHLHMLKCAFIKVFVVCFHFQKYMSVHFLPIHAVLCTFFYRYLFYLYLYYRTFFTCTFFYLSLFYRLPIGTLCMQN